MHCLLIADDICAYVCTSSVLKGSYKCSCRYSADAIPYLPILHCNDVSDIASEAKQSSFGSDGPTRTQKAPYYDCIRSVIQGKCTKSHVPLYGLSSLSRSPASKYKMPWYFGHTITAVSLSCKSTTINSQRILHSSSSVPGVCH